MKILLIKKENRIEKKISIQNFLDIKYKILQLYIQYYQFNLYIAISENLICKYSAYNGIFISIIDYLHNQLLLIQYLVENIIIFIYQILNIIFRYNIDENEFFYNLFLDYI